MPPRRARRVCTTTVVRAPSGGNAPAPCDVDRSEMDKNQLKTVVLLAGIAGLLVVVGSFFGRQGAVLGLMLGLVFVGGSYWFSDTLAIKAARAVPVSEQEMP